MHNEVGPCAEILPLVASFVLYYLRSRFFRKGFDVNC